jgi:hypothetical protein
MCFSGVSSHRCLQFGYAGCHDLCASQATRPELPAALTSDELGRKADVGAACGLDGELEAGQRVLEVALERVHHQRELAVELQRSHARQVVNGRLQQGNVSAEPGTPVNGSHMHE